MPNCTPRCSGKDINLNIIQIQISLIPNPPILSASFHLFLHLSHEDATRRFSGRVRSAPWPWSAPPLSHHPQLQNRSPPGRMPTDRGGCSFQTLPGCVIRAHFPAATGRHLFPLKRTVSMAYLWFNFCFLLHSSPQNCWKKNTSVCLLPALKVATLAFH